MNTSHVPRLLFITFVTIPFLLLTACIQSESTSNNNSPIDSLSMVDTFHTAVNTEDVDAVLALFAEDAVVVDGGYVMQGRDEIRNWVLYSTRMAGLRLTKLNSALDGEKVIWLDIAHDGPKVEYRLYILRWEALIQEGKINTLTAIPG